MKPVSFFRAFWGTCCGSAVFEKLKDQRVWRIVLHLLLLALLLGIVFDLVQGSRVNRAVKENAAAISQEFGNVHLQQGKLLPQKEPARSRSVPLLNRGRLTYLPDGKMPNLSALDQSLYNYFVFWQPDRLTAAVAFAKDEWRITSVTLPRSAADPLKMQAGISASPTELKNSQTVLFQEALPEKLTFDPGAAAEEIYLAALVHAPPLLLFFSVVLLPVIVIFFFALIFKLTGGARKLRYLSFGQFLKIGFYAAMPTAAFASLFPILELPFLSFSTVFTLGSVFYWLHVVNHLENLHFDEEVNK